MLSIMLWCIGCAVDMNDELNQTRCALETMPLYYWLPEVSVSL